MHVAIPLRSSRSALAAALVVALLVLTGVATAQGPPAPIRIEGADPAAFSIALSGELFDDAGGEGTTALHAVLGRNDDFADSLAAGPLLNGGPLLYVPGGEGGTLPDDIAAELQRLLPPGSTVYLAGGVAAVSEEIATASEDLGFLVTRLAGEERTATAAAIADELERLEGTPTLILLAAAGNWPDAVAGGALAASESAALLLTDGETLSEAAEAWIGDHPDAEVVVLGGDAVISDSVADAAGASRRLAGETRAHTAASMVAAFGEDVDGASLVQGFLDDGWVQGNAGAAALQPLLLTGPGADTVNDPTLQALDGRGGPLHILGGADRISQAAADEAADAR